MLLPNSPVCIHYIWRCHNRDFLLDDDAKQRYLDLLAKCKSEYGIEIYGYTLMSNHFHAVLKIPGRKSWERFSRNVNSRLATFVNRKRGRCGQVVMDRPRTIVLQDDHAVLTTLRYIDCNPVRAGLVKRVRDYRWSSYREHSRGERSALVDPCPAVLGLARSQAGRRQAYVNLFGQAERQLNRRSRRPDLVDVYHYGSSSWQHDERRRLWQAMAVAARARAAPDSS